MEESRAGDWQTVTMNPRVVSPQAGLVKNEVGWAGKWQTGTGRPAPPPKKGGGTPSTLTVGCEAASLFGQIFIF